ncbi:MAG: fumarylacetoacetate hydrolase family protein [Pseudomonadota bacterium]
MRFTSFTHAGKKNVGLREGAGIRLLAETSLDTLLAQGTDLVEFASIHRGGPVLEASAVSYLPLLQRPPKIICVGLNYADHTKESKYAQPDYPTLFNRFNTSLVAHDAPMIRPLASDSFDYEGEIAVVLKKGGRHITREAALDCVAGYSLFNDGSVREYQFKSPQWTVGKNFDGTGAFGPDLVTPDELPPGAKGLLLQTRLNGQLVQSANTDSLVFDVVSLISIISEAITLEPGDVIVTGTPSGIGWAREPKLLMRAGDVCEVSVEGLGMLRNPIADEQR